MDHDPSIYIGDQKKTNEPVLKQVNYTQNCTDTDALTNLNKLDPWFMVLKSWVMGGGSKNG